MVLPFTQVGDVTHYVCTQWCGRYVLKVREVRVNHQEEYSTWSNPIMPRDKV